MSKNEDARADDNDVMIIWRNVFHKGKWVAFTYAVIGGFIVAVDEENYPLAAVIMLTAGATAAWKIRQIIGLRMACRRVYSGESAIKEMPKGPYLGDRERYTRNSSADRKVIAEIERNLNLTAIEPDYRLQGEA